jgi:LEA14-like dessication related protein
MSILMRTLLLGLLLSLAACSSLVPRDPLHIELVDIQPLPGEGLEARFMLVLRVQNPNDNPIEFDGVALELQVNQQPLLSGVSAQRGQVPRYGEALLSVPVSLSVHAALRQAWAAAGYQSSQGLPYELRGKLANGLFGTRRFSDLGTLNWPQAGAR